MSDPIENDIEFEEMDLPNSDEKEDPRAVAFKIASWVMEEFQPGFVIIGSPTMGSTAAGFMYPDAIGLVINSTIDLTATALAAVLEELAQQLNSNIDEIEEYVRESDDSE